MSDPDGGPLTATVPLPDTGDRRFVVSGNDLRWLFWNAVVLAIYWAALSYAYVTAVAPLNQTDNFFVLQMNTDKRLVGLLWAFVLVTTVSSGWRRPSDFGLTILYYIALVPALILYGLADLSSAAMYIMLGGYFTAWGACRMPITIPFIKLKQGQATGIYTAVVCILITGLWYAGHADSRLLNVNPMDVYDYRTEASSMFNVGPLGYVALWTPSVFLPLLMGYSLLKRKWLAFSIFFVLQMSCLVVFQEKSVLVPCLIVLLLYVARGGHRGQAIFILLLVCTIAVGLIADGIFGFPFFTQFWIRRFFFDQQYLYFSYYEVFHYFGPVNFSDSFLSAVVHYPFAYPPSNLVAYVLRGLADENANTGFLGAGYMELGAAGVGLYGVMAGFALKLLDHVTARTMPVWVFGAIAFPSLMHLLVSQNLITSLLTGGVVMLVIVLLGTMHLEVGQKWTGLTQPTD